MTFGTIEKILARCSEDADCMLWHGRRDRANHPKIGGLSARRVTWKLANGEIPKKRVVTVTCQNSMCLNPAHLALTTKAAVIRKTSSRLDVNLRKKASGRRFARAQLSKITMDIARSIRASDRTAAELAQELGVSPSLIYKVRSNRSWVESASMWAGLAVKA